MLTKWAMICFDNMPYLKWRWINEHFVFMCGFQ